MKAELLNPADKLAAQRRAEQLTVLVQTASRAWWIAARYLDACLTKHDHEKLGFNPREYIEQFWRGSVSDAFRKLRISRGLAGIPDKELAFLPEANAYKLLELPEATRTKRDWLDKARDLPVAVFSQAVSKACNGSESHNSPDEWATWRISAPRAVCDLLDEALEKLIVAYRVNIEEKPKSRFIPLERLAIWINQTDEAELIKLIEGDRA